MNEPQPPAGSITARVIRGASWMMAWRLVSRSLGFVSVLVLAGLLIPDDFGIVAMASAVTGSIDSMSQLGVRDALVRLTDDRRDYYDTAFTFQVARGVLTGLLIAAASLFATELLGDARLHDVLLVLAALSLLSSFENIGVVGFSRRLDFRSQFLLQAGPRVFGFAVTTALAFLLRSYWALIIGTVVGRLVGVALSYALSPHRPRFGLAGWRYLLHFSFWSWAGSLAIMVLARAEPFLLGPVLGVAAVGLITLAIDIAYLPISELLEPACVALFPGFAMANRSGSPPVAMGLSIAGALALVTIPLSIGVSACSGYLVTGLLGPKWETAQPLIAILAWICMFSPFAYVSGSVLSAQGQVSRVFASHAIAAVLKVIILLSVRHTMNLELIVFASMMTVVAETVIFIWQLRAGGREELRRLAMSVARALAATAITCAVVSQLPGAWAHVPMDRVLALLEGGVLGATTITLFAVCQVTLWMMAGRPPGPERRLASILTHDVRVRGMLQSASGWFTR